MRTAPLPARARHAAIQPSSKAGSSRVLSRGIGPSRGPLGTGGQDRDYLANYQGWQVDAKKYARTIGVARFSANVTAQAAAGCRLTVEQKVGGEWVETEDPRLVGIMDEYRNETFGQTSNELVRLHAWHYGVAGEGLLALRDDRKGTAEYLIVSTAAVEWDNPNAGSALVKLVPGGTVREETAFIIPRDYIVRFWIPDEEWLLHAVSPMTAAMDDLKRYRSLTRFAQRQAENYLAMNGVMWTPLSAHENDSVTAEDDLDGTGTKRDIVLETYEHFARTALGDDNMLEAVIPPMIWWEGDPPKWVEVGRGLDPEGMAHRKEALEDWARGVDLPSQLVVGGGTADANHWGAWLVDDKFFQSAVAPTMDRITHQDLTVAYLIPRLRLMGGFTPGEWRVGYDPADVLVHPDKSDKAARGFLSGLVGTETARREMGFDESDAPTPEDLKLLKDILTGFADPNAPGQAPGQQPTLPGEAQRPGHGKPPPAGPATTLKQPPVRPQAALAEMTGLADYLPPMYARSWTAASKNGQYDDGVMIALPIPGDIAEAAAVPDGEPPESLHMTLVVLGTVDDCTPEMREAVTAACEKVAREAAAPPVDLTHMERFVASGDDGLEPAAMVDGGADVPALREAVVAALAEAGVEVEDNHAFRPHVTLGYWPPGEGPEMGALDEPRSYAPEGIAVHWGPEVEVIPFGGGTAATAAATRLAYSETQPRDESGRFGEGGGGAREKSEGRGRGGKKDDPTRDGKTPGSLTKNGGMIGRDGKPVHIGDRVKVDTKDWMPSYGKVKEVTEQGFVIKQKGDGEATIRADAVEKISKADYKDVSGLGELTVVGIMDRGGEILKTDAQVMSAFLGYSPDVAKDYVDSGAKSVTDYVLNRKAAALAAYVTAFPGSTLGERAAFLASWDESLHPRGEGGRFGESDGEMSPRGDAVAQSIMDRVAEQGGLSVKPLTGEEPTTGFMVARDPAQRDPDTGASMTQPVPADEFFASVEQAAALIDTFIADREAEFAEGAYLGLWHDEAHGEVVLDVVDNLTGSADEAIAAGSSQNQQSIWDVENGVEIETGGTGGREQFAEAAAVRSAGAAGHDAGGTAGVRTAGSRSRAREDADARERGRRAAARRVAATKNRQERVLKRLASIRRDTGRKLLAGAEVAFEEALRLVGVRATTKAKNRSGRGLTATVREAHTRGLPLAPFFAALNTNDSDLLHGAFDSYQTQAAKWLEEQRKAERQLLRDEGWGPDEVDDLAPDDVDDDNVGTGVAAGAAFLGLAMMALARSRIVNGVDEATAQSPGEVSGVIPAGYATQAMGIASGRFSMTPGESPDMLPELAALDRASIEARVADSLRETLLDTLTGELRMKDGAEAEGFGEVVDGLTGAPATEYVWTWGFYGEPKTPFPPHEALDGTSTTDPEGDPLVANTEDWPEGDIFFPGDHLGCTCEWVAQVGTAVADIAALAEV